MSIARTVPFEELESSGLVVGARYRGGSMGSSADDPLARLLSCGNMGGFRFRGSESKGYRLAVLYTTFGDKDWPDRLEAADGYFVYYGDNKKPGCELHETTKGGNRLLRFCFEKIHVEPAQRRDVPPIFVFSKHGSGRDVVFHGLAAPGAPDIGESEDLIATWKTLGARRFQNYRAVFSILDVLEIRREWLDAIIAGENALDAAPEVWRSWVDSGSYRLLRITG